MSSAGHVTISARAEAGATIVTLVGDIDLRSSPDLRQALLKLLPAPTTRLIFDLAQVGYIDSSGVGTFVELRQRIGKAGGQLVLAALQPRVLSVLQITHLDRFFVLATSVDEALKP